MYYHIKKIQYQDLEELEFKIFELYKILENEYPDGIILDSEILKDPVLLINIIQILENPIPIFIQEGNKFRNINLAAPGDLDIAKIKIIEL